MKEFIILIIIFIVIMVALRIILGYKPDNNNTESRDEPWSFQSCGYRGNCLTDCCYRNDCPYYSYKNE